MNMVSTMNFAFGYAHLAAGRVDDAVPALREALELYRRTERQAEGMAAAVLAEALLLGGDLAQSLETAERAIEFCRLNQRDPSEAVAHGVIARALLRRDGRAASEAAKEEFAKAAALIERSGATSLSPALCEWRAELADVMADETTRDQLLSEAQTGYEAIGAPAQAKRLAMTAE